MNKLLILGANPETARLVKKAKNMGVEVSVTDNIANSPAKKVADFAYNVDGMDVDGIVQLVEEKGINGVLVGTADPLVPTYYEVCKKLGFPCYVTQKAVDVFSNKIRLKEECEKCGIHGVPEYTLKQIREETNIQYPIVVKPADGRSGKGITVCYKKTELENAIKKAQYYSNNKQLLFERYMQCEDVFMYYTFYKGEVFLSAMADRYTTKEQMGYAPVVLGGTYPSKHLELYKEKLHKKMCQLFQNLEIKDGILLIQTFLENNEFYVYDPGFRFQGGAPHILMEAVNGFSQEEYMINFALGLEYPKSKLYLNDPFFKGKFVGSQVILLKKGIIHKVTGIDLIENLPEVVSITQRLFEGDEVYIIGSEQQVLLRAHIVAESKEKFRQIVNYINQVVCVWNEMGEDMRLGGLNIEEFAK